jgi:hypothetical protein
MRGSSPSAETARTLILVGLIIDVIFEVVLLFFGLVLLAAPILGGIVLAFAVIGFVWIALIWLFSYDRVREGDYEGSRAPTLVFAILSLITLALIPGILFLIAYIKLGDAIREEPKGSLAWGVTPTAPLPTAPLGVAVAAGPRFCSHCGRANPATGVFCEGCGAPLG